MYEPYVSAEYYRETYGGTAVPDDVLPVMLRTASRHIDSLTFGRIAGMGFDGLTPLQQELVQEVVCRQAEFEYENEDELATVLSGYSINGVSVQFGSSWNVFIQNGVAMRRDIYDMLRQTGLCDLLAR